MNERIKNLKEQATLEAMWPGDPDAGELDAEKFAELIIKECIDAARNAKSLEAAVMIKQHFGVE